MAWSLEDHAMCRWQEEQDSQKCRWTQNPPMETSHLMVSCDRRHTQGDVAGRRPAYTVANMPKRSDVKTPQATLNKITAAGPRTCLTMAADIPPDPTHLQSCCQRLLSQCCVLLIRCP